MPAFKVTVTAKARAKKELVERIDPTHLKIFVKEPPEKGKANEAIRKAVARHFGVPRACVTLKLGSTAKQKIFKVSR